MALFQDGHPPIPGAGRPKGSLNKATEELQRLLLAKAGGHQFFVDTIFAWIASEDQTERMTALKLAMEYLYGKPRQQVEVSGTLDFGVIFDAVIEKRTELRKLA